MLRPVLPPPNPALFYDGDIGQPVSLGEIIGRRQPMAAAPDDHRIIGGFRFWRTPSRPPPAMAAQRLSGEPEPRISHADLIVCFSDRKPCRLGASAASIEKWVTDASDRVFHIRKLPHIGAARRAGEQSRFMRQSLTHPQDADFKQTAKSVLDSSVVWDNHVCITTRRSGAPWVRQISRAHAAGFSFLSLNIGDSDIPLDTVIRLAAEFRAFVRANHEKYVMAATPADIRRAKAENKTAIAFDLEGAYALDGQLSLVQLLYDMGVRWMLMAYNKGNWAAGGCHDEPDEGLTAQGRLLVEEMDRVGLVKCCSHTGYRTARDVLELTTRPVVFSHSNARALKDHPRNIPDDLILACAKTGGVVGLNGLNIFLGEGKNLIELLSDHIDHMADLVGVDHIGLGLDYVYDMDDLNEALAAAETIWPPGFGYGPGIKFVAPEELSDLVEALLRRGYGEADLNKILGGNFLRLAETAWGPSP